MILLRSFLPKLGFAHPSRKDHKIHRKLFRPQMGVKVVNGEDKACRQQGLLAMHQLGYVKPPPGEKPGKEFSKPQDVSGNPDDRHSPEDCKIIEFLPVGKASKPG